MSFSTLPLSITKYNSNESSERGFILGDQHILSAPYSNEDIIYMWAVTLICIFFQLKGKMCLGSKMCFLPLPSQSHVLYLTLTFNEIFSCEVSTACEKAQSAHSMMC
jgi:hypothetical protein